MADVLLPLFHCRDVLAAHPAVSADAVRRWIGMIRATRAIVSAKGPKAELVLHRLDRAEALILSLRVERTGGGSAGYPADVQCMQE